MIGSRDIWRSASGRFLPGAIVASIPMLVLFWPLLTRAPIFAAQFAFEYALALAGYAAVFVVGRKRLRRADILGLRGVVTGLITAIVLIWIVEQMPTTNDRGEDARYYALIVIVTAGMTIACFLPVFLRHDKRLQSTAGGQPAVIPELVAAKTVPTARAGAVARRNLVGAVSGIGLGFAAAVRIIHSLAETSGGDTAWAGGLFALLIGGPVGILGGAALGVIAARRLHALRPWPDGPPRGWLGHARGATVGAVGMALASIFVLLPEAVRVLGETSDFIGLLVPTLMILVSLVVLAAVPFLMLSTFGLVAVILDRWLYESQAN